LKYQLQAKPRIRVISDNDYSGDPDGLVQLAHLLLTPSVEVRGVIGSHLRKDVPWPVSEKPSTEAAKFAQQVVDLCGMATPVAIGAEEGMVSAGEPAESAAAELIIDEALNGDQSLPLYVVCGGSLTSIASAYLREPAIAARLTLVWIGGHGYETHGHTEPEFNLSADIYAAQVVFNQSNLRIWQVPETTYATTLVSRSEVINRMANVSELGAYIWSKYAEVDDFVSTVGLNLGEVLVFGDSPLVLLTALQSTLTNQPASSVSITRPAPTIDDAGQYTALDRGRDIRVFTQVDTRLMVEDFFNKLLLQAGR
jgi:inosine-uridine nucleoside N-ribohydrolase